MAIAISSTKLHCEASQPGSSAVAATSCSRAGTKRLIPPPPSSRSARSRCGGSYRNRRPPSNGRRRRRSHARSGGHDRPTKAPLHGADIPNDAFARSTAPNSGPCGDVRFPRERVPARCCSNLRPRHVVVGDAIRLGAWHRPWDGGSRYVSARVTTARALPVRSGSARATTGTTSFSPPHGNSGAGGARGRRRLALDVPGPGWPRRVIGPA